MPAWLAAKLEGLGDDPVSRAMVAVAVAAEQCSRLMDAGFRKFHVYALNRAELAVALCRTLGLSGSGVARPRGM